MSKVTLFALSIVCALGLVGCKEDKTSQKVDVEAEATKPMSQEQEKTAPEPNQAVTDASPDQDASQAGAEAHSDTKSEKDSHHDANTDVKPKIEQTIKEKAPEQAQKIQEVSRYKSQQYRHQYRSRHIGISGHSPTGKPVPVPHVPYRTR